MWSSQLSTHSSKVEQTRGWVWQEVNHGLKLIAGKREVGFCFGKQKQGVLRSSSALFFVVLFRHLCLGFQDLVRLLPLQVRHKMLKNQNAAHRAGKHLGRVACKEQLWITITTCDIVILWYRNIVILWYCDIVILWYCDTVILWITICDIGGLEVNI